MGIGLGLGVGIGLSLYFWTVMLIQDQQKTLIQENVVLGKIPFIKEKETNHSQALQKMAHRFKKHLEVIQKCKK